MVKANQLGNWQLGRKNFLICISKALVECSLLVRLFNLLCIDFQTKQIVVVLLLLLLELLLVHCLNINMHLPLRATREKVVTLSK